MAVPPSLAPPLARHTQHCSSHDAGRLHVTQILVTEPSEEEARRNDIARNAWRVEARAQVLTHNSTWASSSRVSARSDTRASVCLLSVLSQSSEDRCRGGGLSALMCLPSNSVVSTADSITCAASSARAAGLAA